MTETIEQNTTDFVDAEFVDPETVTQAEPEAPAAEPIKVLAKDVTAVRTTFKVRPALLTPNTTNVRFGPLPEAKLKARAESFVEVGQLEPVGVYKSDKSELVIVWGSGRHAAALYGIANGILPEDWEIRYELVNEADAKARRLASIKENVERDNLSPIEMALAFDQLVSDGMTQRDAAKALKKNNSWGNAAKYLLQLPPKYKQMVHDGTMSAELGYEIMATDVDKAKAIISNLKTKGLPLNRSNYRAELRELSDSENPPADTAEGVAAMTEGEPAQEDPEAKLAAVKKSGKGRKKTGVKATKRSVADQRKFWASYSAEDAKANPHQQAVAKIMDEFATGKCSDKRMRAFMETVKVARPKE